MKRGYYAGVFITVLALLFTIAASPGNDVQGPRFMQLLGTRFINHKGYVFYFQVSGKFKKSELVGTVTVSGQKIKMYCVLRTDTLATCTTPKLKKYVGRKVWLFFAGYGHSVVVPEPRGNDNVLSCYPVFDWTRSGDAWEHFADHCQTYPVHVGDAIDLYNPTWGESYTYFYQTSVPCSDQGNGYYFGVSYGDYYTILCP